MDDFYSKLQKEAHSTTYPGHQVKRLLEAMTEANAV
jgi:hypothetical protein